MLNMFLPKPIREARKNFEGDFQILTSLAPLYQKEIRRLLVDNYKLLKEHRDDDEALKLLIQRFSEERNRAILNGAREKTNPQWLAVAILEDLAIALVIDREGNASEYYSRFVTWEARTNADDYVRINLRSRV